MAERLGYALWWLSILIAGGWVWINRHNGHPGITLVAGGLIVLTGFAARYILAD